MSVSGLVQNHGLLLFSPEYCLIYATKAVLKLRKPIQDSHTDWAFEAARVKDVYGGTTLTIAATNSSTTNAGIFHPRLISPNICQLAFGSSKVSLRLSTQFSNTALKAEVLNTRGWTLQESILSPRVLSYGSQQMVWECQTLRIGESRRPVLPRGTAQRQSIRSEDHPQRHKLLQKSQVYACAALIEGFARGLYPCTRKLGDGV